MNNGSEKNNLVRLKKRILIKYDPQNNKRKNKNKKRKSEMSNSENQENAKYEKPTEELTQNNYIPIVLDLGIETPKVFNRIKFTRNTRKNYFYIILIFSIINLFSFILNYINVQDIQEKKDALITLSKNIDNKKEINIKKLLDEIEILENEKKELSDIISEKDKKIKKLKIQNYNKKIEEIKKLIKD